MKNVYKHGSLSDRPPGSGIDFKREFTTYRCCAQLGYLTNTIRTNFRCHTLRSQMKIEFNLPVISEML